MKKLILGLAAISCLAVACNDTSGTGQGNTADTVTTRNVKTAMASCEALNKHDANAVYKDCSSDFVDYGSGEGKPMTKIDSLKANMQGFFNAMPDFKGENMQAIGHGDSVVVLADWGGTFKKDYMGMKATGKSFKVADADIFTFNKEGKITTHRSVQSQAAFFAQLGISMPAKK